MSQTTRPNQIQIAGTPPQLVQPMPLAGQTPPQPPIYQLGRPLFRSKARWRAYLGEWLIGLALMPFGGIGALIWLYYFIERQCTVIEGYSNGIVVHSGFFFRTVDIFRYYQFEDIKRKQTPFDVIAHTASLHFYVDSRKRTAGRLREVTETGVPGQRLQSTPKDKIMVIRGLGDDKQMERLYLELYQLMVEQRIRVKGVWA